LNDLKRLYIFTGKGGVGKTTLSFSFAQYLKENGKKVKYVYFNSGSISSKNYQSEPIIKEAQTLGIETLALNLEECSQKYIGKKLKSPTLGKWVVKTPFFKALINMIPGFNYLIYLGQILELLNNDPELIYVLDSPSSGHALTMLEASHNFRDIFESGIVFDDTKKMIDLLFDKNFLKVNILTIPTLMAVNESVELNDSLQKITSINTEIFCNNCFKNIEGIEASTLPDFLIDKIDNEQKVAETYQEIIKEFIPHIPVNSPLELIKDLVPSMKNLV